MQDEQAQYAPPQPQQQTRPQTIDELIDSFSPQSKAWVDRHPEFKSDDGFRDWAIAGHARAVQYGCTPDSEAYFNFLDQHAAKYRRAMAPPPAQPAQPAQRPSSARSIPASSMAAPSSRIGGSASIPRGAADAHVVAQRIGVSVDDLRDAAQACKMPFDAYVKEQIAIAQEWAEGRDVGLIIERGHR
jgi:hypothetical protein